MRAPRLVVPLAALLAACSGDSVIEPPPPPPPPPTGATVDVTIVVDQGRTPISPLIYGSNQDDGLTRWTIRRYGGNRLTGYNWETNFSNAGSDWQHSSDTYLLTNAGLPAADTTVPGRAVTHFHDQSVAMGAQSIVTLQMAGWVAADAAGPVDTAGTAPSARWARVEPRKNAAFTTTPSRTDCVVYMDEFVSFLVGRYGPAPEGVTWYSLDNEPALWSSTHPRIHPAPVGAAELVSRSVALAGAVKAVDPAAGVLGPAAYGMSELVSLQDAPDWSTVRGGHDWFVDYYLDRMKAASDSAGRRLLDAFDLHYYPEARGDHRITAPDATTSADAAARLQAPRTLWDSTYRESSWIGEEMGDFLPLIPRLKRSIAEHYPGTKLAVTEYDFGGGATISGGIAQADVLGIFGKYGVDVATRWGIEPSHAYATAAFELFRDYDGQGGAFGSTAVKTISSDAATFSAYASIHGDDASTLHVILLNKSDEPVTARLKLSGGGAYLKGQAWGFDATTSTVSQRGDVSDVSSGGATVTLPALSAVHVVLKSN